MIKKSVLAVLTLCFSLFINATTTPSSVGSLTDVNKRPFITLGALEFPPYAYTQAGSQECIGYVIELTRQIFTEYGFDVRAVCAPAVRIYRMMQTAEIDLTVNIRSTKLLQDEVTFFSVPFGTLELLFISHQDKGYEKLVSGIRGFDYHGQRQRLIQEGYIFQDTPGSIDAIKMFVKERTRHLLTYKSPYKFYLEQNGFNVPAGTNAEFLLELPTYFVVAQKSNHHEFIINSLTKHAADNKIKSFEGLLSIY